MVHLSPTEEAHLHHDPQSVHETGSALQSLSEERRREKRGRRGLSMDPQWGPKGRSNGPLSSSASISGPLPSVSVCVSVICPTVMPLCFPLISPEKLQQMASRMGPTESVCPFVSLRRDGALKDRKQSRHTLAPLWGREPCGGTPAGLSHAWYIVCLPTAS